MDASSTYMTTGNWTVAPGRNVEWPLIIKSDGLHGLDPLTGKNIVAVVAHGHEAHAALLAAAPVTLEALEGLRRRVRDHFGGHSGWREEDAAADAISAATVS